MKSSLIFASLSLALVAGARGFANQAEEPSAVQQVAYTRTSSAKFGSASVRMNDGMRSGATSSSMHTGGGAASSCGDCGSCGDCVASACCDPCNDCCWMHKYMVWGEFLALRARNTDVAYAVETNGVLPPGVAGAPGAQVGQVAVVDQDYEAGFRVGFGFAFDDLSSISAQYTFFETDAPSVVSAQNFVLGSLVHHPATAAAPVPFLDASARHDIRLDLVDVDYRHIFKIGNSYAINWLAGARYAHLDQIFNATFTDIGVSTVDTRLNFDGGGIRVGLEGERVGRRGFLIYGKSAASFVGGEFRGTYRQDDAFFGEEVDTSWTAARLVTMLDLELGLGWYSPNGRWRLSGGYLVSGWFNVVKTDEFIQSVQTNDFTDLSDAISFDGWSARVEYRF